MSNNKENEVLNTSRELVLKYYNDYLLERGIITKQEHSAMNLAIINDTCRHRKRKSC